ncbi:XRE family transcriptional regulator [Leucobacter sp. 1207-22]|uniref:XRE family transcriptional regulator n=1 Tax=Leucobacter sp. 1207-22 TaxID=2604456 RepID=UPI00406423E1
MIRYLSLKELAERIGVEQRTASKYKLPEPDAMIGTTRGWLPETVDAWNAGRPGRGAGGGRKPKDSGAASA